MTAGDVINVNMDASANFQPAANVELIILQTFRSNAFSVRIGFTDGVLNCGTYVGAGAAVSNRTADWRKFGITNSQYYWQQSLTFQSGISMIQIK